VANPSRRTTLIPLPRSRFPDRRRDRPAGHCVASCRSTGVVRRSKSRSRRRVFEWRSVSPVMRGASRYLTTSYGLILSENVPTCQETSHLRSGNMDRETMTMNRHGVRRSRLADRSVSSCEDDSAAGFREGQRIGDAAPALAHVPEKCGTVHAQLPGVGTRVGVALAAVTRKPSGNRQWPARGIAGGIGSLARGVGAPSHASRRTGGHPGDGSNVVSACALRFLC
jgi:hypothetical protein